MILAGSGGIYEGLLIVLAIILIFNGLKRQKIMKKVDAGLDNKIPNNSAYHNNSEQKTKEEEYIDFEEISD